MPELRELTVLYTDIADSTAYAQKHGWRLDLHKKERHHEAVRPILDRHGAQHVRVVGDATQSVFEDTPAAADCAVEILRAFAKYNAEADAAILDHDIRVRIGIDHGKATQYQAGGQTELAGNLPNVGARVIAACGKSAERILLSDAALLRLLGHDRFRTRALPPVDAAGVGLLRVHELSWHPGAVPPPPIADGERREIAQRAHRQANVRGVHCWLVGLKRVVPVRVSVAPRGTPGAPGERVAHPVMEAAAGRAIASAFGVLHELGFPKGQIDRHEIDWWLDGVPPELTDPDPGIGLAVALATVAAYMGVEIDPRLVVVGSVHGERVVTRPDLGAGLAELAGQGFAGLLLGEEAARATPPGALALRGVASLDQAVRETLGPALGLEVETFLNLARGPAAAPETTHSRRLEQEAGLTRSGRSDAPPLVVEAPADGFLTLLAFDPRGQALLVLPDARRPEVRVRAGERVECRPDESSPPGLLRLVAYVTRRPITPLPLTVPPADLMRLDPVRRLRPEDIDWLKRCLEKDLVAARVHTVYLTSEEDADSRMRGLQRSAVIRQEDPLRVVPLH